MIDGLRPYPEYGETRSSPVDRFPAHWRVERLGALADLRVSSVDKVADASELPVRLCNYTDVYKHDRITAGMPFMFGTATASELQRFRIEPGDVLITKDSETWNDIGVPAVVASSAPDLVSGYHLALLRPGDRLLGQYLFRALQIPEVAYQLHINANGVTRFGLSHNAIKSIRIPLPPKDEQAAIVRFLQHADERIRRYIIAKQKFIELLEEQKQAITDRAVTRGVGVRARLKPSGLIGLGDIPAHWDVRPAKWFFREVDERSSTGAEELLSVSHITGVTPRAQKNVTMLMADSYVGHKVCLPGDLVINTMWAWMGALGVSSHTGLVSPAYGVYRPHADSALHRGYAHLLLRSRPYVDEYIARSTGIQSSRLRLYPEQFLRIQVVCPPPNEQLAIVAQVTSETAEAQAAIQTAQQQVKLIREFRTRLISDVVTGQLDVRAAAAGLPDPHAVDTQAEAEARLSDGPAVEEDELTEAGV